jgi:phosphoglycerate dehydrogenase-like enzyme
MKVLFTYNYGKEKIKAIEDLGYEVIIKDEKTITYSEELDDVEILVCYNPFETLDIMKMKSLKLILLSSIGIDQVPKDIIKEKNIILCNNKGGYSIPIGEWIVLKILEMLKKSKASYENQRLHKWKMDTSLLELYGKTVTFIGTGSLAKEGAKRLQGFEANILGINTSGHKEEYFHKCYSIDELDKVLHTSDVVVITIPYTEKTHHLIDKDTINKMKDGVFLVNVARGSIIDESSLIEALKTGKISFAALDVFEEEPLNENSILWELENVIINSHNSWISEMRNERRFTTVYKNLNHYKNNENLFNVVDLNKGY